MKTLLKTFLVIVVLFSLNTNLASASNTEFKLTSTEGEVGDNFGYSLAISEDTAIIGAPFHDYGGKKISEDLNGVWGSSDIDVFAVGNGGAILHYDGIDWIAMTNPSSADLHGVWGSSDIDVFAVGNGGTILHYDGFNWITMTNPSVDLHGVWGSSDSNVFAVGTAVGTFGVNVHYDGISWSPMGVLLIYDTPMGKGFFAFMDDLNSVWGSSASDVFAVGKDGAIVIGNESGFLVTHYNNIEPPFSFPQSPSPYDLNGVWGSSDIDVYAVGNCGTILHYDGSYWSRIAGQSENTGVAYVFRWNGSTWSKEAKLSASDLIDWNVFGYSVAISGETVVIGARNSAYVFVRSGSTWNEQAKLTGSDAGEDSAFGFSVAISGDTAVIGAYGDDDSGANSGSAYVFVRSDSTWSEQDKLTASDGAANDSFGGSVAVSDNTAVIGAGDSAYVFVRSDGIWSEQDKLTATDGAANDFFGGSVAVSGETAIIGAYGDDDSGANSGSAYVFVRSDSTWSEQAKLLASDGEELDSFGYSVDISGDKILIGTPGDEDNGTDSGSAYMFVRSDGTWSEQTKLIASDGAANDFFGGSVSVSNDNALIGTYWNDDTDTDLGSAYIYVLTVNHPPVADANGPYWIDVGDDLLLDASGSYDPDEAVGDSIVSYDWDFGDDGSYDYSGSTVTVPWAVLAGLPQPKVAIPIRLHITDSFGVSDTDTTELTIFINEPVATFTANPNPSAPTQLITFDASSSSHGHSGHNIVLYEWDFDGDGVYDLSNSIPTATHSYSYFGSYTAKLRVTDDNVPEKTDLYSQIILVNQGNRPPFADANGPYTTDEGDIVTLDASGSSDPDDVYGDTFVSYEWDLDNDGQYDDAAGVTVNLDALDDASFIIGLKVTDSHGATSTDTTTVTINNVAPVVSAGDPRTINEGETVAFSGSFTDPGTADTHNITWDFGDGSPPVSGTLNPSHVYADDGVYTAELTVTDDDGGIGSDTVMVTVEDLGPTAVLTGDTELDECSVGNYDASSSISSPDAIVSFEWDWDYDSLIFNPSGDTGTTHSHIWKDHGAYTIAVRVTDDDGSTDIATLSVTIENPPPEVMVENLSEDIDAMEDLPASIKNSLTTSLDTANKVLEDSNPKNDVAAINTLEAFINKVEAQRGKKIPTEIADELIAEAQEIIAALSGGA